MMSSTLLLLTLVSGTCATYTMSSLSMQVKRQFVEGHNRRRVWALKQFDPIVFGNMERLPNMTWSDTLAADAADGQVNNQCNYIGYIHDSPNGHNHYRFRTKKVDLFHDIPAYAARLALKAWTKTHKIINYTNPTGLGGPDQFKCAYTGTGSQDCSPWTQMVNQATISVGCAVYKCEATNCKFRHDMLICGKKPVAVVCSYQAKANILRKDGQGNSLYDKPYFFP